VKRFYFTFFQVALMKYIKAMTQQKLSFLLALYIGLFMNGAVFFRRFDGYAQDFTAWKGIAAVVELVATVLVTFFLLRLLSLFGRRIWRVLATLVVLCSAGASYYMTFMNVVIGYGIIASVMTTDIDLSKEVVGLHFILWLVASAFCRCCLSGTTAAAIRYCANCVRQGSASEAPRWWCWQD